MHVTIIYSILLACVAVGELSAQPSAKPKIIFDTDMGPDYDDVGAITLLHAFADKNEAELLATIASTRYDRVAVVLNVLNTYFKRPQLPIAVAGPNGLRLKDVQHWSDTLIQRYPHRIQENSDVPDAVTLYRQLLAKEEDNSVTIVTVGFFTNIADLLKSGPDKYSSLSGKDLVSKKVKFMVSMAGKFPAGKEFNVEQDAEASRYVSTHFPRDIIFSGFEIGAAIKTGLPLIRNDAILNSPVKDVFRICIPLDKEDAAGRMSWDQTAALVAVRGYTTWFDVVDGHMTVEADGSNGWSKQGTSHRYLVFKTDPAVLTDLINNLMMHQP